MNTFIKYKDYLRGIKASVKQKAEYEETMYDFFQNIYEKLQKANPLMYKKAEKMAVEKMRQLGIEVDSFDKKAFESGQRKHKYTAKAARKSCNMYGSLISSFDNEKAIKETDLIEVFTSLLIGSFFMDKKFSTAEISTVLGSAVYYNQKKQKNTPEWLKNLSNFYNYNGSFNSNNDNELFKKSLYTFLETEIIPHLTIVKLDFEDIDISFFKTGSYALVDSIIAYHMAMQSEIKEDVVVDKKSEDTPKFDYEAQREVNKYFKDGEIIAVPEDIEDFIGKLIQLGYTEEEVNVILKRINKTLSLDNYLGLLTDDDLKLINTATEFLNTLKPYDERYFRLIAVLKDIDAIKELYKEAADEEKDALIIEKSATMTELQLLLDEIMPKEVKITNNLIFLPDKNNTSYFAQDLDDLETVLKNEAIKLLDNINVLCVANFRPVKADFIKPGEVFEVASKRIHIIFKTLGSDTYLVLGVSKRGDYQLTNRLTNASNQEYFSSLAETIVNNEEKQRLLAENQILREGLQQAYSRKRNKD